jgi:L-rhamnose mutarotase
MNRYCFLLRVKPELLDEYRARHRQVWPEMLAALASKWTVSVFAALIAVAAASIAGTAPARAAGTTLLREQRLGVGLQRFRARRSRERTGGQGASNPVSVEHAPSA